MKNNKSPGVDNILNEHIKRTIQIVLPIYTKLFNIIFDKGITPESWFLGNIRPIYKNKGNNKLPKITDQSHFLAALGSFSPQY